VLGGPAEARFPRSETRAAVVLRPRDWAGAYRDNRSAVSSRVASGLPPATGIAYHRATTDTPFGVVLREALAPSTRAAYPLPHPWVLAGLVAAAIPLLLPPPGPARAPDRRLPGGTVSHHHHPRAPSAG